MAQDNIKALYGALKDTYELGSEDDFRKYLSNGTNREALRKELEGEYEVGDSASFSKYLGFDKPSQPQQQKPQQKPAAVQQPATNPQPLQIPQGFGELDLQQAQQMGMGKGYNPWQQPQVTEEEPQEETFKDKLKRIGKGQLTPEETKRAQSRVRQRQDEIAYEEETGKPMRQQVLNTPFEAPTLAHDEYGNIRRDENGNPLIGITTDEDRAAEHQQIVSEQEALDAQARSVEEAEEQARASLQEVNEELDPIEQERMQEYVRQEYDKGILGHLAEALMHSANTYGMNTPYNQYKAFRQINQTNKEAFLQSRKSLLEYGLQLAEDTRKDAQMEAEGGGFFKGLARAYGKAVEVATDPKTWDFGANDMEKQAALFRAVVRDDNGVATEDDRKLLDDFALSQVIESGAELSNWTKAGLVTGESLPFMLEMLATRGGALGTKMGEQYMKYAVKKYGANYVRHHMKSVLAKKVAAKVAGDLVASHAMAGTTGIMRTMANTYERMRGDINTGVDENGRIIYDGHEVGESAFDAFSKAWRSTAIENWSEMAGEYLPVMTGFFGKAVGKAVVGKAGREALRLTGNLENVSLNKAQRFIYDLVANKGVGAFNKGLGEFMKRTQWHGTIGEYAEEVLGNLANAITIGDMTLDTAEGTGVFNLQQNIETFNGVALMGGFMSALHTGTFGIDKYRNSVSRRTKQGAEALGDNWERVKASIDSSIDDPTELNNALTDLFRDGGTVFSTDQKQAIMNYVSAVMQEKGAEMANYQPRMANSTSQMVIGMGEDGKLTTQYAVTSYDKNGEVIEQQTFKTRDEADAYQGELKMQQQNQDFKDYLSMVGKLSYGESSSMVDEFLKANGYDEVDDLRKSVMMAAINDPSTDFGRRFREYKTDKAMQKARASMDAIAEFEAQNGWTPGTVQWLTEQDPMQLDDEGLQMADQAREFLKGLAYPNTEVRTDVSAQEGTEAADGVVNQIANEPANVDPQNNAGQQIANDYLAAKNAREQLFGQNEEIAQEVTLMESQGYSPQEILSSLDTFSEADRQILTDWYNAQAKYDAYMMQAEQKINEAANMNRQRRTFTGTINGQPDNTNLIYISDGQNTYTLVSGNIRTNTQTGQIMGSDSGLVIALDENGDFVQMSDASTYSVVPSGITLDQYEASEVQRLQEAVTQVTDPNGALQQQQQADNSVPGREQESPNVGTNDSQGGNNNGIGRSLTEDEADDLILASVDRAIPMPEEVEMTPENWAAEFGNGVLTTPLGEVKISDNQYNKMAEKGRSKEFGMIKPTLTDPDFIIEESSEAKDGNTSRPTSYLFVKAFVGKNGEKRYFFKSVTVEQNGMEVNVSNHFDRVKRLRESLKNGKLLYRFDGGAQTEQTPATVSVTTPQTNPGVEAGNSGLQTAASQPHGPIVSASGGKDTENIDTNQGIDVKVDKNGVKLYEQGTPIDDAIGDILRDGYDPNQIADLAIGEAQDELSKMKEPKSRAELIKNDARRKELQTIIDYYTQLKQRYAERNSEESINNEPQQSQSEGNVVSSQPKLTVEEQKQERIKALKAELGEFFDDDFTKANDVYELVSMWLSRERRLSRDSVGQELGWNMGVGKDGRYIETMLAKKGEGMSINDFVHMVWESPENDVMGEKRFDTEEIKEALLYLFQTAKSKSDVVDYAVNTREQQARAARAEQQQRDAEAQESGEVEVAPITDEEQARIDASLPFARPVEGEDIPENPLNALWAVVRELTQDGSMPQIRLVDTTQMSDGDWINLASEVYGGAFVDEETVESVRNYAMGNGVVYDEEADILNVFSGAVTPESLREKLEQFKIEYNESGREGETDSSSEPLRDSDLEPVEAETPSGESGEGSETPAADGAESAEVTGTQESVDEYLQPRNAEEEKIIADVLAQLQQEIQDAVDEQNKARSELQKAQARESERATDMFSDDEAFEQPGQLFSFDDMGGTDRSQEGVERRTEVERRRLQQATDKLNQLQSEQERNSRIRGALDNHRKQTSFEKPAVTQQDTEPTADPMAAIEQAARQFKQEREANKPKSAKIEVGSDYGKNNKVVSQEEYNALVDEWRRLHNQLNSGIVTATQLGFVMARMAAFHIEAGARKFADFVKRMVETLGTDTIPYLKSGYLAAKYLPGMEEYAKEMDSEETVRDFDLQNYDKQRYNSVNDNKQENNEPENVVSLQQLTNNQEAVARFTEAVSDRMMKALESGEKPFKSINDIRNLAKEVGLDVDTEGRDDIFLQELVEDGLIKAGRKTIQEKHGGKLTKDAYDDIVKLYEMQPTIGQRSSNRIKMQQYSTPTPMSFIADMFAYDENTESVLEPTAGNGMMVFAIPQEVVHVNELDETRLSVLKGQPFKQVTNQDATLPFEGEEQYDAIIANPPFGAAESKEYDGKWIPGLAEQIALNALSRMKDNGKAAIIIGGNMEYAPNGAIKSQKAFFTYLYDHYNVKGVIDMGGKLYQKQGTTWPTRMILIEGRRSEEERAQSAVYPPVQSKAPRKAETFEDLFTIAEEIKNNKNKTNGTEILRTQEPGNLLDSSNSQRETDRSGRDGQPRQDDTDGGRTERGGSTTGSQEPKSEGTPKPDRPRTKGVQQPAISGLFDGEPTSSQPQSGTGTSERPTGNVGNTGRVQSDGVRGNEDVNDGVGLTTPKETNKPAEIQQDTEQKQRETKPEEKRDLETEKLSYRPHNSAFSLESVAPAAMVEAMDEMLKKIEKENGSIDNFVTRELGYDSVEDMHNALAAEQVDSVAMAIYQMKQGQGMIIGDQTGVGKGRQMAALIRWACRQGKKPVFITQKADLFSDIYRDLVDVGSGELRPFIFNSDGAMVDNNGVTVHKPLSAQAQAKVFAGYKLPDGYDFAVLTYSQVNTGDAISMEEAKKSAKEKGERFQKKKKGGEKSTPKATFLRAIAKDNYLFMDESHTAAGKSNTGAYFQSILKAAKAVTFASATFAKRPDTMPMYAIRTAMSKAKVKMDELISIIENGGVTLQEIMSRALTQAGQMVRRERDMSDVKTDWKTVDDPATVKKARDNYDLTIGAFNAIIDFQKNYVAPFLDNLSAQLADVASSAGMREGTEDFGIKNVPFASKTYNYTKQLMLALKVDAIVDEVVKEIEAGRHPVIALENTMGSMLDEYTPGEVMTETSFAASLLKGLKGILRYTVTDEDNNKQQMELTPSQLGPEGEKAYHELEDKIREATSGIFISPLDAITEKLRQKGYSVGELTGRQQYVEMNDEGEYVVRRRTDRDKKKMQREFNNGTLDVLILNKSASTGISLHASEKFSDQRQRTMIIAQPLADINDYMQMIGRIDRTGQVHRGYYINLGLPVPAEGRFLMMLSTKLKSLNANTTTSQDSESNEVDAPDLLNKYGSQVVVEYLKDNPDAYVKMGEPLRKGSGKTSAPLSVGELDSYVAQEDDARKITGYVALLSTDEQDAFYNDVVRRYNELIQYLNDTGSNDLKISVMPLNARTIEKQVSSEGADPKGSNPFAGNAYVEWVEMDVLKKPMKAAEVGKVIEQLNPEVEAPDIKAKTAAQEKAKNQRATSRVKQIVQTIVEETQAKLDREQARYETALAKAEEDIKNQTEKINNSKRTPEQKREAIDKYTADKRQSIEESHKNMVDRIKTNRNQLINTMDMFEVGDSYLIPDDLDTDTFMGSAHGIFCGFKAKDEGITPSTTLAVFCTLDGRRKIEIKLSDRLPLVRIDRMTQDNWDAAHQVTLSNWDSQIPSNTRKHGYIMTGNILQAFADSGVDGRVPGQLVTYTDTDGNVHDGILMNQHWEPSMLKGSSVPLKSRMDEIKGMANGDHITSADGNVVIERSYYGYSVTIPKSKKLGAQYYENDDLLEHISGQNFYPYRGQLKGDFSASEVEDVVNILSDLGVQLKSDNQVQFAHETTEEDMASGYSEDLEDEGTSKIESVKDYILSEFISSSAGEAKGRRIPIGVLTEEGRAYLESVSSMPLKPNVSFNLNASDLRHIYNEHYGSNEKDTGKNIPLTDEDIRSIVDVISSPDVVVFGTDKKDGKKIFYFLKDNGNGTYNLAEVYSDKHGNLTAKSFYKTKKGSHLRAVELLNSSTLSTSETSGASLSSGAKIPKLFDIDKTFDDFNTNSEEINQGYSEETDEEVIERLEKEPKVKVYRAMSLIDGRLYPPMATKQDGSLVNPIELGKWEKSDEHPEKAVKRNGKWVFKLTKDNGKSLFAAYNPYIHTSTTMLNDQFSEAQDRPNLVVVEVEVPESELTSGYKAEKAKDAVGKLEWKAGIIQGQLTGTREVILSRWDKPVRIVPTEEVAKHIANQIKGKVEVMPTNVVTPQQREALEKEGVKFVETDNRGKIVDGPNKGKTYSSVYGKKAKNSGYSEDADTSPFFDMIADIFKNGYKNVKDKYERARFKLGLTPSYMKKLGIAGEYFEVSFKNLKEHLGKDSDHMMSEETWNELPNAIQHPFLITRYNGEPDKFRLYTNLKFGDKYVTVGVDVRRINQGKGVPMLEVNAIKTVFAKGNRVGDNEEVITYDEKITPEQEALLRGRNFREYPTIQELSEGKDKENSNTLQENRENINNNYKSKIKEHIDKLTEKLGTKNRTTVIESIDQVKDPKRRAHIEKAESEGRKVYAWFENGKVYLYLPNISSIYQAEQKIWHETVAHIGLRELLGADNYGKLLNRLWMEHQDGDMGKWVSQRMQTNGWSLHKAIDEYLAREAEKAVAERQERKTLWQKLAGWVGDILRELGYRTNPTITDIRYLFWLSENQLKEGEPMSAIKQAAFLHKLERETATQQRTSNQSDMNSGFSEDIDEEIHEGDSLERRSAKQKYERDLSMAGYVVEEAYRDAMLALKKAQYAIGGENIPDSQNAYMAENQMHSKNKIEQDRYMHFTIEPLIDTINQIMARTGMDQTEIEHYIYAKSALERNRQFYVRDFIDKRRRSSVDKVPLNDFESDIYDMLTNRIEEDFDDGIIDEPTKERKLAAAPMQARQMWLDKLEDDFDTVKQEEYLRLREGEINLADYLGTLDAFIIDNIGDFNPSENDYSGLTDMYGDEEGKYSDMDVIIDVMSTEDMINGEDAADEMVERLWGQLNDATQYGLDREHDAGLISDESYKRATKMFHWYVPLRGFNEATAEDMYQYLTGRGKAGDYVGKTLKHAKGRKSQAKHPISTIFTMANNSIVRSNRNLVKQKFYRLVNAHDNDLVVIKQVWAVQNEDGDWVMAYPDITEDMNDRQIRAEIDAFEERMREKEEKGEAVVMNGKANIPYRVLTPEQKSEHIIEVSLNGQRKMMIVNSNPRLAQALNGLTSFERGKNIISKLNGTIKNWMASVFTNYSITFGMRNMMRDWTHFRVSLNVREGEAYAHQAARYYREALPKMHSLFKKYRENKLDMNNPIERDFKDFMENGGVTGYVQMKKVDEWQKEMDAIIQKMNAGKVIKFNNQIWDKILGAVEGFNEAIENTARFATYRTSRNFEHRTKARSAYDAKEVTVNFNRKGAGYKTAGFKGGNEDVARMAGMSAQVIGEGRLFFNATIQAIANVFKGFRNPDGSLNKKFVGRWAARFAAPPFFLGLALPFINQMMYQMMGGGDGDDPYANLAEWTRRKNICLWIGGNNFLTIPIGQELAAFMSLGDIIAGLTYKPELKPVDRTMDEEIMDVLSTFSPIDFGTKLTDSESFWTKRALDATRPFSVAAPIIAIGTNYGWTGRPIYRTEWGGKNLDPEYQKVYSGTNPLLVQASKTLHELGGGDEVSRGEGMTEINPAVIQYLWEQYTGGPGKFMSNAISIGKDVANWDDNEFNIRKVEGLRAFVQQGDDRTKMYRTQAKYFKYKKDLEKLKHDVSGYKKLAGESPELKMKLEQVSKSPDFVRMQILNQADKQLQNMRKAANQATGKKRKELNALYDEQLKLVVDKLDNVGQE